MKQKKEGRKRERYNQKALVFSQGVLSFYFNFTPREFLIALICVAIVDERTL